jgi:hypothetical protein
MLESQKGAQSAEEAADRLGRAVVAGDMATILRCVTPDGLARLMELSGRRWFNYFGYTLGLTTVEGDDRLVQIEYDTDLEEPHVLRYRFQQFQDGWKAVDIERVG